ncbi:J domain-containing protein [Sphaerotilus sp.]|uniref:J domain-containing protein n=1 Tax=Sphaerotilus sp. TaxID=2093942 RepID=UPI002ACD42A9|nr:DnaJ domain-containing protein [Sphaerotilus sp.]MDZ7858702.1 DnaJ domain-containing protein [Sphaerotilus sp.]
MSSHPPSVPPAAPDHYQTLGLARHAEPVVVKAAYRALASLYHPDRNPAPDAIERIQRINIAHDVLSDPVRRQAYDATLLGHHTPVPAPATPDDDSPDPLAERWKLAAGFFPEIRSLHARLERLSGQMGDEFRLHLLQHQQFAEAPVLAERLRTEFMGRHFGTDVALLDYAEQLLLAREIDAARFVSQVVSVLGSSVTVDSVREKIEQRFPRSVQSLQKRALYARIAHTTHTTHKADGTPPLREAIQQLVGLCGGVVQRPLLRAGGTLLLGVHDLKFEDDEELRQLVVRRLAAECG